MVLSGKGKGTLKEAFQVFVRELNKLNRLRGVDTIIWYQKAGSPNLPGEECDNNLSSDHTGARHKDGKNRTRA